MAVVQYTFTQKQYTEQHNEDRIYRTYITTRIHKINSKTHVEVNSQIHLQPLYPDTYELEAIWTKENSGRFGKEKMSCPCREPNPISSNP